MKFGLNNVVQARIMCFKFRLEMRPKLEFNHDFLII